MPGGIVLEYGGSAERKRVHAMPSRVRVLDRLDGACAVRTGHVHASGESANVHGLRSWQLSKRSRIDFVQAVHGRQLLRLGCGGRAAMPRG